MILVSLTVDSIAAVGDTFLPRTDGVPTLGGGTNDLPFVDLRLGTDRSDSIECRWPTELWLLRVSRESSKLTWPSSPPPRNDIALSARGRTCRSVEVRDLNGAGREPVGVGLAGRLFRRLARYSDFWSSFMNVG